MALAKKVATPMTANYSPELDASGELCSKDATYYQSLIGILRWIVEMGWVDICMKVSAMSLCVAMPREGHMQQVLHIFAYLKIHHNAMVVFDPSYPKIDNTLFEKQDWNSMYGSGRELRADSISSSSFLSGGTKVFYWCNSRTNTTEKPSVEETMD